MKKLFTLLIISASVIWGNAFAQTANIPTARYSKLAACKIGMDRAISIGAKSVRMSVGINGGSLDTTPSTIDLTDAIDHGKVDGINDIQLLFGYAPAGTGPIKYLPDESTWPDDAKEWQAFVDAAHFQCGTSIKLSFEIANEPDTRIGAPFDTIKNLPVWQELGLPKGGIPYQWFRYMAYLVVHVDFHGHALCLHMAGSGGNAQKTAARSWKYRDNSTIPNDAAASIIAKIKASGGWIAYNTYPNVSSTFTTSPQKLIDRYLGYTVPNTGNVHTGSVLGVLPWRLGETQIPRGAVPDSLLTTYRLAYYRAITKSGRTFTLYVVVGDDPIFSLYGMNGVPTFGAISLKP